MRKEKHKSLKMYFSLIPITTREVKQENYIHESRLLKDVKAGKEPEKKHLTLDNFFKDSQIQFNVLM